MEDFLKLIALFLILFLPGIVWGILTGKFDKKEELLRDIRDELRKKNKSDEAKEGRVIE